MGTQSCTFHPQKDGRWRCFQCHLDFCIQCIPNGHRLRFEHLCPVCEAPLIQQHKRDKSPSVYRYIVPALRYPWTFRHAMYTHIWLAIAVVVALFGQLIQSFGMLPPLTIPYYLLLTAAGLGIYYLGYLSLLHTARGMMYGENVFDVEGGRSTASFLMFTALWLLVHLLNHWGAELFAQPMWWQYFFLLVVINLFLPSSMMLSIFSDQPVRAVISPFAHIRILLALRGEYLCVVAVVYGLGMLQLSIAYFAHTYAFWFSAGVVLLLNAWLVLVCSHLTGYLVVSHSGELGFSRHIDSDHQQAIESHGTLPEKTIIHQVRRLNKQHRHDDSLALLEHYCRHSALPLLHLERVNQLLDYATAEEMQHRINYSINILADDVIYSNQLCRMLERIMQKGHDYQADPELLLRLLTVAETHQRMHLRQWLAKIFIHHYPEHRQSQVFTTLL